MQELPVTSDPSQTFDVTLGALTYSFWFKYNDMNGVWTFDLTRTLDQVALLVGVPLLIGQDMLSSYALGIGGLVATDESGAGLDAGPDDLGDRVTVTWLSPAELAEFLAAGAVL